MNQLRAISTHLTNLKNRAFLEQGLRKWFQNHDFLEVTTPVILPHSSLEENIQPLKVSLNPYSTNKQNIKSFKQGFLRVSPELSLKKILTGIPKIFELGPCFRDLEKSDSPEHLNEFTLLEWYHTGITLSELINEFIDLVHYLIELTIHHLNNNTTIDYNRTKLIKENWKIITMAEAFREYADIDFDQWDNWDEILLVAKKRGFNPTTLDDAFYWLFLNKVEPEIRSGPTIIYEYPIFQASFSEGIRYSYGLSSPLKKNKTTSQNSLEYGLRFEAYLGGMEICNGFQELLDPSEQRRRWQIYLDKTKTMDKEGEYLVMDGQFLSALENLYQQGQPISGVAVGWERLLMFLLKAKDIREIQPLTP